MTPKQIIDDFREEAHDSAGTTEDEHLWKTSFLLRALNEARMQATRRARLISDGTTSEVCKITVKASKMTYDVDKRILYVRRVKHSLIDRPLPKTNPQDADEFNPGWESTEVSEPCTWIPWGDHQLRLWPPPDTDATIMLFVEREPLADVTIDDDEAAMEIEARYHYALKDWMMFRAYMQRDLLEKYRPEEAKDRMTMFEAEFGPATSAVNEKWMHRKHGYDQYEGIL
jgi:hypothetical protein